MGVLSESWCFCKGVGRSERMKGSIFTGKGPAMLKICGGGISGTGFLIHRNLVLTTHVNIPSVSAAESLEIRLHNGLGATLVPHRFFVTSSVLDLTIVGLDSVDGDSNSYHYIKICSKPNMDLGSVIYLLGCSTEKQELIVGEGKVVIATDNLIKLSTDGVVWSPGSAGFDVHGNLAFMICDPMKLATSPNTQMSSSSTWKNDSSMQFGIPIPSVCDWLNQHWEGSLDGLTKPKLALIRLMSSGQKSDHACASFTLRQVFKPTENGDGTPSSSNKTLKARNEVGVSEGSDPHVSHIQGIPTPEIYESPKLTATPIRKKENSHIQLLDINFPPKIVKPAVPVKQLPSDSGENSVDDPPLFNRLRQKDIIKDRELACPTADAGMVSSDSVNGGQSEVQSCCSPIEVLEMRNGYSSEGETTMYSAETAESRNFPSPREDKSKQVGRSQSCVGYNRWGNVHSNPMVRRGMLDQRRSFVHGRKMYSPGATSQRSNEYFSPTASSVMKKRNSSKDVQTGNHHPKELPSRTRQSAVHSSPRWMF